jgi:hypothetical protein
MMPSLRVEHLDTFSVDWLVINQVESMALGLLRRLALLVRRFSNVDQYTIAAEIFPSHPRSQGSSYSLAAFFLTDVLWVDAAAIAQAKIGCGWKYYLIFLYLGIVHLVYLGFKILESCISHSWAGID